MMFFVKCFNVVTSEQLDADLNFSPLEEAEDFIHSNEEWVISRYVADLKAFLDSVYDYHVPIFTKEEKGYHLYFKVERSSLEVTFIK
ncbi:hypothetical protein FZC78_02780 [Rossellomorea vietnamensis]|uniref:Uncharacterized protein n=1 Tax=Rossellomorea vietnamensis TaxID=218284 RepID=A0A5D4NXI2_9BACI|nr:hypothetical protein [Rossellomorea vietnamensis]TYS18481.1 hypothetical protein FZC78_02780 [Rossellomorea vietnamensis]